jgi:hypothetical protein
MVVLSHKVLRGRRLIAIILARERIYMMPMIKIHAGSFRGYNGHAAFQKRNRYCKTRQACKYDPACPFYRLRERVRERLFPLSNFL